jgi:diguanylate cyclase (GGDEF)-like protein
VYYVTVLSYPRIPSSSRATRSGRLPCIALLDLDHFKAYNDEHSHQAGDRLLKAAAAAWQDRLRKTDLLARYDGGEEFAVLLPDCALDNAMEIAERLRTAQPGVTCSIGVADWDGREDVAGLVARADRARYAAKARPRPMLRRSCRCGRVGGMDTDELTLGSGRRVAVHLAPRRR